MTTLHALLAFGAAATLLTITPGLDTALVLRHRASGGSKDAALAALGVLGGCLSWGIMVSVGLGGLIAASLYAYTLLKWIGAAYLFWVGIGLLLHPRSALVASPGDNSSTASWQPLRQGLFTNLLNPKVGVFYLTFLPQFVPPGASVTSFSLLLAFIHIILGFGWFTLLIIATAPIGALLSKPKVIRVLDRSTGGLFLLFAGKLAISRA